MRKLGYDLHGPRLYQSVVLCGDIHNSRDSAVCAFIISSMVSLLICLKGISMLKS